jgi:hypothetical protein
MTRTLFFIAAIALIGCPDQSCARNSGGSYTETLPAGRKLINVTWKGDSLWFITRPMKAGEEPETYEFKESSSIGILEGTVTIVETR